MGLKTFKKDAEIDRLQGQLDALQGGAPRQTQMTEAERAAVVKDYHDTMHAIVDCTGELKGLLEALEERRRQCMAAGVRTLPQPYVSGLITAVKSAFQNWDNYSSWTGKEHERESAQRTAVRNAETALAHRTKLMEDCKARLVAYKGSRSDDGAQELLRRYDDAERAVRVAQQRLVGALLALGSEATQADRRRALELEELERSPLTW